MKKLKIKSINPPSKVEQIKIYKELSLLIQKMFYEKGIKNEIKKRI